MTREEKIEVIALLEEKARRIKYHAIRKYFPDSGPLRRELYAKHMEFFKAGVDHRERLMCAANRVGKTESVGGYETTLHLTGIYPAWWMGRRFDHPVSWWASGDTGKTTRDIIQYKLLGPIHDMGSGLIPKDKIISTTRKAGVADAIETISVKHVSGGMSKIGLKSYDQRREAFQGTEKDGIWLDEEPPQDVYTECVLRTMTNDGMILLTFTPLSGVSDVVLSFMPNGCMPADQVPIV